MALAVAIWGRRALLAQLLPYLGTLKLRLYTNDYQPTADSTEADFIEPTFDGYAAQLLDDWHTVYAVAGPRAQTDERVRTFTVGPGGGSDSIYGYWTTDPNGHHVFGERFAGSPVPMNAPGDITSLLPRFLAGALQ